jgi:WD40 repeat protein
MDHTARLFDIHTCVRVRERDERIVVISSCEIDCLSGVSDVRCSGKCKQTFRGHVDAVNRVAFLPFTNTLASCSGDKTVCSLSFPLPLRVRLL